MPPKTLSEKVDELRETASLLSRQADQLDAEQTRHLERVVQLEKHVDQLRLDSVSTRQDLAELRKSNDEWGRRLWMIVPPLLSAILSLIGGLADQQAEVTPR